MHAEVAQLVEHDLAKVGVASSSLVFRSKKLWIYFRASFFLEIDVSFLFLFSTWKNILILFQMCQIFIQN